MTPVRMLRNSVMFRLLALLWPMSGASSWLPAHVNKINNEIIRLFQTFPNETDQILLVKTTFSRVL